MVLYFGSHRIRDGEMFNKATDKGIGREIRGFLFSIMTVVFTVFISLTPTAQAAFFNIPSGDVTALIEALNAADSNNEDDTITLEEGTYNLTEVDNTTDGANGLPVITGNVTIVGVGAESTIIKRDENSAPFRIIYVADTGALTLDGVTIKGGFIECCDNGGGILNRGILNIKNSTVSENSSGFEGGGIANYGSVDIINSVISNNSAQDGGGIFNRGNPVTIAGSTVSNNSADGFGGGINGTITVTGSIISYNTAGFLGGGISGVVTLTNSVVLGNSSDFNGGGISIPSGIDAESIISRSTVSKNRAAFLGGGIINGDSAIRIRKSTVFDNSSGFSNSSGDVKIVNCTFRGNEGTALENADGIVTVVNSTIAENGFGIENLNDGVEFFGIVDMRNTILALNGLDCHGPITSVGRNLIGKVGKHCRVKNRRNYISGDPGLGPFTDDGGPGKGHFPLLPTSRAIDAGGNNTCTERDQIGQPRVGLCDIGAIEFQIPKKRPRRWYTKTKREGSIEPRSPSKGRVMP
jgi:hypothetical protein